MHCFFFLFDRNRNGHLLCTMNVKKIVGGHLLLEFALLPFHYINRYIPTFTR